jgi:dTDP-4-dehydrorhamnose reductase
MSTSDKLRRCQPVLWVTGASGTLGHWVCVLANKNWSVVGSHRRHAIAAKGVKSVKVDLTRESDLDECFNAIEPHAVIHTAAISQPGACEDAPDASHAINVKVPALLAERCHQRGVPFLFTSTDLVFDGRQAPYDEQHPVTPLGAYGRQKALSEAAVLDACPGALVCRMPLMYGVGPRLFANFSLDMLFSIQQDRPITLFYDEFRTPVDFKSAAQGLLDLLGRSRGLLHLGGRTRVSRYALGLLMAEKMGVVPSMLKPVSIGSISFCTTRPPDCSLNSRRAYSLGYDPLPLADGVRRVVGQFDMISNG